MTPETKHEAFPHHFWPKIHFFRHKNRHFIKIDSRSEKRRSSILYETTYFTPMPNIEQFDTAEKIKEAMDALASKYEALISEQRAAGLEEARSLVAKFNLSAEELGLSALNAKTGKSPTTTRRPRRTAAEMAAEREAHQAIAAPKDEENVFQQP